MPILSQTKLHMKFRWIACLAIVTVITVVSCKTIARAALKYWTNQQIKEFVGNCSSKASLILGEEKASKYCDCAVEPIAEKFHNYNDVKRISISEIFKIANDCK